MSLRVPNSQRDGGESQLGEAIGGHRMRLTWPEAPSQHGSLAFQQLEVHTTLERHSSEGEGQAARRVVFDPER